MSFSIASATKLFVFTRWFFLSTLTICVVCGNCWISPAITQATERDVLNHALASITQVHLQRHVEVLADDTFEGREAGSRGGRAAGLYIIKELTRHQLKPLGDDGTYFQSFEGTSRNILGLLEGSDPVLKNEVLVLGAHYDHVGYGSINNSYGPLGKIHNGADDNASGVSGLLEVIEAFKSLPTPPARSILFAFWDGEEKGLNGSRHWIANPTLPKQNIAFAINLDMIGRLRENHGVEIIGTRSLPRSRQMLSQANRDLNLPLDFVWTMKEDSDHWTFFNSSIPVIMFHTGLHDEYHRPSDDVHLINYKGMEQVSRLIFNTTNTLANQPQIESFRADARREGDGNRRLFERPLSNDIPRFGVTWTRDEATGKHVVTNITPGSPASTGGIQVKDVLEAVADWVVDSEERLRLELLYAASPTPITVIRPGTAEPVNLKIQPHGQPVRIGIRWREDAAEPGVLFVSQVLPHSAAFMGGVSVEDRIYRVNGEPFTDSADFIKRTQAEDNLTLTLERNGRSREVKVELLPMR